MAEVGEVAPQVDPWIEAMDRAKEYFDRAVSDSANHGMPKFDAARVAFIEEVYPVIFGPELMGDSSATISAEGVTRAIDLFSLHLNRCGIRTNIGEIGED